MASGYCQHSLLTQLQIQHTYLVFILSLTKLPHNNERSEILCIQAIGNKHQEMVGSYVAHISLACEHALLSHWTSQHKNSKIKLKISEWQQQSIKPSMWSCVSQAHEDRLTWEEMEQRKGKGTRPSILVVQSGFFAVYNFLIAFHTPNSSFSCMKNLCTL